MITLTKYPYETYMKCNSCNKDNTNNEVSELIIGKDILNVLFLCDSCLTELRDHLDKKLRKNNK